MIDKEGYWYGNAIVSKEQVICLWLVSEIIECRDSTMDNRISVLGVGEACDLFFSTPIIWVVGSSTVMKERKHKWQVNLYLLV